MSDINIVKICSRCGPLTLEQVRVKIRQSGKSAGKRETICINCATEQNRLRARHKDPEVLKQHRERFRHKYRDSSEKEMRCSGCDTVKEMSEFNASMLNIRYPYCIPCSRAASQKSREKHYKSVENARLKREYGIDLEDYQQMLEAQNHVCEICQKPESQIINGKRRKLSVDHNHKTGLARGLLCFRCNASVGVIEQNMDRVAGVMEYIEKYK